jgi:hypothetical protein
LADDPRGSAYLDASSVWDGNTLLFSLPEQAIRSGVISVRR